MVIAGAGGHSKDVILLLKNRMNSIVFFDDVTMPAPSLFLGKYSIINSLDAVKEHFIEDNTFVLGLGGTNARKAVFDKLSSAGGEAQSITSETALIGDFQTILGKGLNIMPFVFVSNYVKIGNGSLINTRSSLHHNVEIGSFCDIAPSCTLLGGVKIGDFTSIGSSSTILPNVKVGNNCIIGAGSVVTQNVPDNSLVLGVPARKIRELNLDVESG